MSLGNSPRRSLVLLVWECRASRASSDNTETDRGQRSWQGSNRRCCSAIDEGFAEEPVRYFPSSLSLCTHPGKGPGIHSSSTWNSTLVTRLCFKQAKQTVTSLPASFIFQPMQLGTGISFVPVLTQGLMCGLVPSPRRANKTQTSALLSPSAPEVTLI